MSEKPEAHWVTLLEVNNGTQADLIRSVLEGFGIKTYIPQESFNQALGGALGMKIMVNPGDLEKARGVLEKEITD